MAKNLFRNLKRDWSIMGDKTEHLIATYARHKILPDLQAIDNEYEIKFPFQIRKNIKSDTGTLTFFVEIPESAVFIRETDGETIHAAALFTWLDKGISVSHVRLIRDPETGEEKAIASKRNFRYNDPYPPKNWTIDIAEYHHKLMPKVMSRIFKRILGGNK